MYKGELGTANAHKILLKDIGKLFLPEAPVPHCTSIKQWGKCNRGTFNLPIAYTSWYVPMGAYGTHVDWKPERSSLTVYIVSLSKLNVCSVEGSFFWFFTIGK